MTLSKGIAAAAAICFLAACSKTPEKTAEAPSSSPAPVSNAATEYAAGLKTGLEKAHEAADKANAAIAQQNQRIEESLEVTR